MFYHLFELDTKTHCSDIISENRSVILNNVMLPLLAKATFAEFPCIFRWIQTQRKGPTMTKFCSIIFTDAATGNVTRGS